MPPKGRHQARELALKVLFQLENKPEDDPEETLLYLAGEDGTSGPTVDFARGLVRGVLEHQSELDAVIAEASRNWRVGQMAKVDRQVLRIATYELLWADDVPDAVAVDEAVELAKTLSTDDSPTFVNGLLGRLVRLKPTLLV